MAGETDSESRDQGAASSKLDSQPKSCQKFQDGGLPPTDGRSLCDQRFFMTWISPVDTFGPRELLALESVFKWHPSACLVIFSRSMDSDGAKKIVAPFLARGYRIMAVAPDLTSLFHGTPAERWFQQLKDGLGDPGEINLMQNLSNLMRLVALYKYGGIYLDTDIIVLKSLADLRNVVGAQSIDPETRQWSRLNNAVLVFDKAHPLVHKFIEEFAQKFDGSKWGYNGPYLVSRVVEKIRGTKEGKSVAVLRPQAFYPVNWNNILPMFRAPVTETEIKWQVHHMKPRNSFICQHRSIYIYLPRP
jgi:lactosylceramide 4-alpha-galactosyltransferase